MWVLPGVVIVLDYNTATATSVMQKVISAWRGSNLLTKSKWVLASTHLIEGLNFLAILELLRSFMWQLKHHTHVV